MRKIRATAILVALTGCVTTTELPPETAAPVEAVETVATNGRGLRESDFLRVAARIEPLAERMCREGAPFGKCNFLIVMDDRADQPANAYQFLSDAGRPILAVTIPLLNEVRNEDELALVLGHEAAHHIAGHLDQQWEQAYQGALLGGFTAAVLGGNQEDIDKARDFGAFVGMRQFSKGHEIEADQIGARIALMAGYDPIAGVAYFSRFPDPGNKFLGTHPPNKDRIAAVRAVVRSTPMPAGSGT
jgi:predicted Zn-dependent protease